MIPKAFALLRSQFIIIINRPSVQDPRPRARAGAASSMGYGPTNVSGPMYGTRLKIAGAGASSSVFFARFLLGLALFFF